jgi:hypothetical protein
MSSSTERITTWGKPRITECTRVTCISENGRREGEFRGEFRGERKLPFSRMIPLTLEAAL